MESISSTPAMEHQNTLIQNIIQEGFFLPIEGSMQFSCYFCTVSYNIHQDLVKHMVETHHATLSESSVLCVEAEFLSPEDQQRMISGTLAEEEENDVFDCEVCGQTFPDSSDLETHMKKHKDSFIYCCDICGRRYKEQRFLKTHKKTHSSQSGGKNKNMAVPETPITINGVVQEKVTRNFTSPYKQCMDCGFIFQDKEALLEHRKENHNKSTKFLEFLNLQPASPPVQKPAAKRKYLAELDPIVTCQAWQLATTGKLALDNGKKKENSFEFSGKSVKGKQSANVEETESVKNEDGASPIQDMDEIKSESSASYDGHFMMESPHTPADPADNEGIKMEVVSESEESAGYSTPKKGKQEEVVQRKGLSVSKQCGYCKKSFGSRYYLNIHLRTHTGEKPYKCDHCQYTSAQKTSLRYHLERHHNYKAGQSNEKVKSISKKLSKKELEEPPAAMQPPKIQSSPLPMNGDKVDVLSSKPTKRMSALRNKLVTANQNKERNL